VTGLVWTNAIAQEPPPYQVITADGTRALPVARRSGTTDFVALDALQRLFGLTMREDPRADGVVLSAGTQRVVLTSGQATVSAAGRLVSLSAPVIKDGSRWLVPIDFLRVLDPLLNRRIEIRREARLIVLDAAARYPQRVEKIALIAVAYPMKVTEPFLDAARRNDLAAFDMHTIWGHAAQVPLGSNPNPGMWMYGDNLARLRRLAPGALYSDLKASNDYVFSGTVQCPVLLVLGKRDVMTPPRAAQELHEKIPHSELKVLDLPGHGLMGEAPDATLDALVAFLAH